jgi:CMP/dCMP kinase
MKKSTPLVITISRQLGSGGAYIGQQLAKKLNFVHANREIISMAAKKLSVLEKDLVSRDEKTCSFWQSFLQISPFVQDAYIPPAIMPPGDHELFEAETEIIENIAKKCSAVIIGRCGFHILRNYPNHVSIFLHGDSAFREARIQKLYNLSEEAAGKMIAQKDRDRAQYCKTITGREWADARNYNISIDTGKVGVDKTVEFIIYYLKLMKKGS